MTIDVPVIRDDELLAFLVEGALEPERVEAIRAALARSPALALRLATVSSSLDDVFEAPARDDLYEARLWKHVESKLRQPMWARPQPRSARIGAEAPPTVTRRNLGMFAIAATVLVAVGVGFIAGRIDRQPAPVAPIAGSAVSDEVSNRVLALHLASYFESAERALLVAANSPDDAETAKALARELIDGNRVYAAAAERAGRPQLADFLRQLEPVLLELANGGAPDGLVAEQIVERDLAFKSRAAAALARRELIADSRIPL